METIQTAGAFRLDDVTNQMVKDARTKYARFSSQKRVELVSFRCSESLMQQIEDHCADHKGLSQSLLVSDLVALGLSVMASLTPE